MCAAAHARDTLVFRLGGEASILNPILSTDTASGAIEGPVFNGLFKVNEKLELVPDLCRSFKVSKDGKVWTFHLRKDVLWHDGLPFTAHDAKFTFDAILNPKVNSVRRGDYIIDGEPIKFKVVDAYTLQAILPRPFAPFKARASMSILPKHILEGTDINTSSFNRKPVGTGPFRFKEWLPGDQAVVTAFDRYYLGKPKLSEIVYKIIPDDNAGLVALETGHIDTDSIPPKDFDRIKKIKEINTYQYDVLMYVYMGLNLDRPFFANKKVRQALAYATDRDQLIKLVLKGFGSPAYCPMSPVSWAYSNDVARYKYDIKKAKQLLKKAGYEKGFEFTCLINQGNKEREKAAIILQQQYKKIGVKMKIRVLEWSALLKIVNNPGPKDFDAVIMGWSLGIDPDSYSIWHSSQYPKGFNFVHYSNPEADKLLELGRTTIDQNERKKL
ncbi:MAG: peptide-binding protein, partial [Candidatus Margulisiibacteriota bacterium]